MLTIAAGDVSQLYLDALGRVLDRGERVGPRGQPTLEVSPVALTLTDPTRRAPVVYGRRANPSLMLAEVLWLFAGRDDVRFLSRFSTTVAQYAPADADRFPDAYGPRLRRAGAALQGAGRPAGRSRPRGGVDQLRRVIRTLGADPDSRRATLTLWDPRRDGRGAPPSVPCNVAADFKLRGDGLHLTVFNRSNDLHIGFLFNVVQFGALAEFVGLCVGARLVTQTHVTTSLHAYLGSAAHGRLTAPGVHLPAQRVDVYDPQRGVPTLPMTGLTLRGVRAACAALDASAPPAPADARRVGAGCPWLEHTVLLLAAHRRFPSQAAVAEYAHALDCLEAAARTDWWVLAAAAFHRRLSRRATGGAVSPSGVSSAVRALARLEAMLAMLPAPVAEFAAASGETRGRPLAWDPGPVAREPAGEPTSERTPGWART